MKTQRLALIASIVGGVILIWMAMVMPTAAHFTATSIVVPFGGAASDATIANEQPQSLSHAAEITFTPAFTSYLPFISNFKPHVPAGINGKVTYHGVPISGIDLTLYRCFLIGTDTYWSCPGGFYAQYTSTLADGSYQFPTASSLGEASKYRVKFRNDGGNPNYVSEWYGPDIFTYTAGQVVQGGSFDIANTPLLSPSDAITVGLPVVFRWAPRAATPSDSYRISLWGTSDNSVWQSPPLGYVGSYTLTSLPVSLTFGTQYAWFIEIDTNDGKGFSQESRIITFSSGN